MTPKTVLSGTAISAMMIVSQERMQRLGEAGSRGEEPGDPVLERAVDDEPDREDEERAR